MFAAVVTGAKAQASRKKKLHLASKEWHHVEVGAWRQGEEGPTGRSVDRKGSWGLYHKVNFFLFCYVGPWGVSWQPQAILYTG